MARMKEVWATLSPEEREKHKWGGPGSIGVEVVEEDEKGDDEEEVTDWVFV